MTVAERVFQWTLFFVSLIALYIAINAYLNTLDTPPMGVCVTYDVNTVGTMVDTPVKTGNVISCTTGTYVTVTPVNQKVVS